SDLSLFSPDRFRYTTRDGMKMDFIDGEVERIEDPNGNVLTITSGGVNHSSGESVTFERDPEGRVTRLVDPSGAEQLYQYSATGDLAVHTDAIGSTTKSYYDSSHGLLRIEDPLSHPMVRSEYDDDGRLIAIVDAEGNRFVLEHDLAARLEIQRDPGGATRVFEYDETGNVIRSQDATGGVTLRDYDAEGNMTSETNPLGGISVFAYESNALLAQTDPLGNTISYSRDESARLLAVVRSDGRSTDYGYDARGNLTGVVNPDGSTRSFAYDTRGNRTARIDEQGGVTQFEYDSSGRRTRTIDSLGNATDLEYDTNGRPTSATRLRSTISGPRLVTLRTATYDPEGNMTSATDAGGALTLLENDAAGQPSAVVDSLGRRTEIQRDAEGQPLEIGFPGEFSVSLGYTPTNQKELVTNRSGATTMWEYDGEDRPTAVVLPDTTTDPTDNRRVELSFNSAGVVESLSIPGRGTQLFEHDLAGRPVRIVDPEGGEILEEYDSDGRVISRTDGLGRVTLIRYDSRDNVVEIELPDGTVTGATYDSLGNLIAHRDGEGHEANYEWDTLGRLTAVVDPLGNRTEYSYDELGNLLVVLDAAGHATRFEYDDAGRRVATIRPGGARATFSYDSVGNPVQQIDFNGDEILFTYDERNLVLQKLLPGGATVDIEYTDAGKRASVADARGITLYQYDHLDRLSSRVDPDGKEVAYTYDESGQVATLTTPAGTVQYEHDPVGRLARVLDRDGDATTYTYDLVGQLITIERPNGIVETLQYDSLGRVAGIQIVDTTTTLASFEYTHDQRGNVVQVVENPAGRVVEFTYDSANRLIQERLTEASTGLRTIDYSYDSVGNRLSRNDSLDGLTAYQYDSNGVLASYSRGGITTSYSYDQNGNILRIDPQGIESVDLSWSSENRLVEAAVTTVAGTETAGYTYDLDGLRTSVTLDGTETRFLLDANRPLAQVAEEYAPGAPEGLPYLYGERLLAQGKGVDRSMHLSDAHSGVRLLVDASGAVVDRNSYDAYGGSLAGGTSDNRYRYRGQQIDSALDAYYLRARYYDPELGRFLSSDPFEGVLREPLSLQRYLYANDNPVTFADPSGLLTTVEIAVVHTITAIIAPIGIQSAIAALAGATGGHMVWEGRLTLGTLGTPSFFPISRTPSPEVGLATYSGDSSCVGPTKAEGGRWITAFIGFGAGSFIGSSAGDLEMYSPALIFKAAPEATLTGAALYFGAEIGIPGAITSMPGIGHLASVFLASLNAGAELTDSRSETAQKGAVGASFLLSGFSVGGSAGTLDATDIAVDVLAGFTVPVSVAKKVACQPQ
ncbi:MAG: RHS repeat protein, partial [bacterium]|nr:RHS repeat protein [bacterium]